MMRTETYFNYKKPPDLPFALKENYEESARIMERVGPKLGTGEGGETPPLILQTLKNIEQLKVQTASLEMIFVTWNL